MKREFLMLAQQYKGQNVDGWLASEKLDGMRAWWDGGISRGKPKASVTWANKVKDSRYREEQIATGLWTRLGNVIHAPDWWLNSLPNCSLDGELYSRESRQAIFRIIKDIVPGEEWKIIGFYVFECPPLNVILEQGKLPWANLVDFQSLRIHSGPHRCFIDQYERIHSFANSIVKPLEQVKITREEIPSRLEEIVRVGGEGLMLRMPYSFYECCRSRNLLKVKQRDDAEGTLIGYEPGLGKYMGMIGSLTLRFNGKIINISGLTDSERMLPMRFPIGCKITFSYRGMSEDGTPMEAQYMRPRVDA